jgi:hypothetical protein
MVMISKERLLSCLREDLEPASLDVLLYPREVGNVFDVNRLPA